VQVALYGQAQRSPQGLQLADSYVPEFRLAQAQVAESEGQVLVLRVELCQQPRGSCVRGEELHDRVRVDRLRIVATIPDRGPLGLAVLEQLRAQRSVDRSR
jgi:hypothetical protein